MVVILIFLALFFFFLRIKLINVIYNVM